MIMMYAKYYLGTLGDILDDLGDDLEDLGDDLDVSIFLFWLRDNLTLANNIADIRGARLKPPLVFEGCFFTGFFAGFAIGIFYYNYNKLISQQILEYYIYCYNCCYKV